MTGAIYKSANNLAARACDQRGANSLIISSTADVRVNIGGLSALFLIQLPLSAAKLRRGGMVL